MRALLGVIVSVGVAPGLAALAGAVAPTAKTRVITATAAKGVIRVICVSSARDATYSLPLDTLGRR